MFYWISLGVVGVIVGFAVAAGVVGVIVGFAVAAGTSFASGVGAALEGLPPSPLRVYDALLVELIPFVGLVITHTGLLTLVACYGLWTFRKWGLSLAKRLAVAYSVAALVGVVLCLVTRSGIVGSLVNMAISVAVMIYLFGSADLSERIRTYYARLGTQTPTRRWDAFD